MRRRLTNSSLYLIDDKEDAVLLGERAKRVEECRRRVVVSSLCAMIWRQRAPTKLSDERTRLDGLDDERSDGLFLLPLDDRSLDLRECPRLGLGVLSRELVKRVLEEREGDGRPVVRGDIELVDRLGAGEREGSEETRSEEHTSELQSQ